MSTYRYLSLLCKPKIIVKSFDLKQIEITCFRINGNGDRNVIFVYLRDSDKIQYFDLF